MPGVLIFIKDYFIWHYSQAFQDGLAIWKNFLWFVTQFFSLRLLFRTLFSPWRRMKEYRGHGFDPQKFFETLIINIMMRLVGFIIRVTAILIGLAALAVTALLGVLVFILWLGLPFFIILFLSKGIMLFF